MLKARTVGTAIPVVVRWRSEVTAPMRPPKNRLSQFETPES